MRTGLKKVSVESNERRLRTRLQNENECLLGVCTSEMSINFYEITRPNILEDNQLHPRLRQNLKSHGDKP
jgi:hypothetical protein